MQQEHVRGAHRPQPEGEADGACVRVSGRRLRFVGSSLHHAHHLSGGDDDRVASNGRTFRDAIEMPEEHAGDSEEAGEVLVSLVFVEVSTTAVAQNRLTNYLRSR